MNKIIENLSPIWRWILFIPIAYAISILTYVLVRIVLTESAASLLKIISLNSFVYLFESSLMFLSTFTAVWVALRIVPKYPYLIVFSLNLIYVIYQCFNTSKFNSDFFVVVSSVVLASLLASYLVNRKNKRNEHFN